VKSSKQPLLQTLTLNSDYFDKTQRSQLSNSKNLISTNPHTNASVENDQLSQHKPKSVMLTYFKTKTRRYSCSEALDLVP